MNILGAVSAGISIFNAIKGGDDAQNVSNAMLNFRRKDAMTNMTHQLELAKIARVEDIVTSTAKSIQNSA